MPSLKPDRDKNFGGSLVFDFGQWWRHVKTIYRSDMVQLSKKKLYLTFTATLSKISHDTLTAICVISSFIACCSVLTGKSTASIHCYKITRVNFISIVLASSWKIRLVKNLNRAGKKFLSPPKSSPLWRAWNNIPFTVWFHLVLFFRWYQRRNTWVQRCDGLQSYPRVGGWLLVVS